MVTAKLCKSLRMVIAEILRNFASWTKPETTQRMPGSNWIYLGNNKGGQDELGL